MLAMPDDNSFWDHLPEPVKELRPHFIWTLIGSTGSPILAAFAISKVFRQTWEIAVYVALTLVALAVFVTSVTRFLRSRADKAELAGMFFLLLPECRFLLEIYRRLQYNFGQDSVRYPLNHSSWPNFGMPWQAVHAELYARCEEFDIFRRKLKLAWQRAGRTDEPAAFRLQPSSDMLDVTTALEELQPILKEYSR